MKRRNRRAGFTIIAAIFIVVIMALLAMVISTFIASDAIMAVRNYYSLKTFYIANAGAEYYLQQLSQSADWSTPPAKETKNFAGGVFSIATTDEARKQITLISTGTLTQEGKTYQRSVMINITRKTLLSGARYGLSAGDPFDVGRELKFQNSSKIIGSFYYFGPILILGDRPPPCQTDGVIKSTSISYNGPGPYYWYYTSWEAIGSADFPEMDNTYYDNWLNLANANGQDDPKLGVDVNNISLGGGTHYYKDFTMTSGTLTGPGTVCVTAKPGGSAKGRFIANGGTIIGNVRIIARGTNPNAVDISGNTAFTSKVEIIGLGPVKIYGNAIIPPESIVYSKASGSDAVQGQNNAILQGSVLAPNGEVTLRSNSWIKGLAYGDDVQLYTNAILQGAAFCRQAGYFHDNTKVIQDPWVLPSELPPGLSGLSMQDTIEANFINRWSELY